MGYYRGYGYEWSSEAASDVIRSPWKWMSPSWWRDRSESKRISREMDEREKEQRPIRQAFFESLEGTEYYGTPFSSLGR